MVHSLPLLLLLSTARADDPGVLPLVVRAPLQALWPAPPSPPPPPVQLLPGRLDVAVHPMGPEAIVTLRFDFELLSDAPLSLPLVGSALTLSSARLDGRALSLPPDADGWRRLAARLSAGHHVVELAGSVATPHPAIELPVVRASRARVAIDGDWRLTSPDGVEATTSALDLLPTDRLRLTWEEPRSASPRPAIVQASAVTALAVDATGVLARSRIRFRLRHQPADTLRVRLPAVDDLQVEGPALASWERQGDSLVLHLVEPVLGAAAVELSWRTDAPDGEGGAIALPQPETTSGRLEAGQVSVQAGDQGTPVVMPSTGLDAIPVAQVEAWGRGMVPGTPLLSMAITAPNPTLRVRVLDLSPADEPPTVVDSADIRVAYAAHGRALLRCSYQVRNDKNQYLGMRLPEHSRLLGVRVAGNVVQTVADDAADGRRLFIPLEKSVETLQGLVSFPVEVMLLVDADPWQRRGQRTLQAPALDAPVASARWELLLPPGVAVRELEGSARLLDADRPPGARLTYGRATGLSSSSLVEDLVEEDKRQQSQEAWNEAYRAYKDNEFEQARDLLDESLQLDADNRAAQALAGNVDLLLGDDDAEEQEEQARRIRALARAKTGELATEQAELEAAVDEAERAGDAVQVQSLLGRYASVTRKLAQVEDTEAVEQKSKLKEAEKKLEALPPVDAPAADLGLGSATETTTTVAAANAAPRPEPVPEMVEEPEPIEELEAMGYIEGLDAMGYVGDVSGGSIGGTVVSGAYGVAVTGTGEGGGGMGGGGMGVAVSGAVGGEVGAKGYAEDDDGLVVFDDIELDAESVAPEGSAALTTEAELILETRPRRAPRISFGASRKKASAAPAEPAAAPAPAAAEVVTSSTDRSDAPTEFGPPQPPPPPPATVPSALSMDPAVTAAPLITPVPAAGPRLVLEQHLLAPDQALTATLTYRLDD